MSRDAKLIAESWTAVKAQADKVAQYFYTHMFYGHPDVRAMFPVMIDLQRDRLLQALVRIVRCVDSPELLRYLRQLGRDHRKFAVTPAHYRLVGESLIAALARYGREAWNADVEAAWRRAYGRAAQAMIDSAANVAAEEPPWRSAQVVTHERRAPEIAVLTVRPDTPIRYLPGQYVALECPRRPRLWRSFAVANAPRPDGTLEFHVKAVPDGWLSRALVYRTGAGDHLRLGPPVGSMVADPTSGRDVVCVAGSTGLAPIKAIVEDMTGWDASRQVTVFVGARHEDDLYDVESLEKLALDFPWLRVVSMVSGGQPVGAVDHVAEVFASGGAWDDHDVYVCGPAELVRATLAQCHRLRLPRVRHEAFGPV
jgi:NAD(P)H-flavin reductase/hemoglobin-like flavoprotein